MSKPEDTLNEYRSEVEKQIERLSTASGEEQRQAAAALCQLGIWTRGSILPRGSLSQSAENRLPKPEQLPTIVSYLKASDRELRCEVARALGEWGDQQAAQALANTLRSDPDEQLQLHCVAGLRNLGGPIAVDGLGFALTSPVETVRRAAITAIEDLATGGRIDDTERSPVPAPDRASAGVAGTLRMRGSPRGRKADLLNGVRGALNQIRSDPSERPFLRNRAEEVLNYLGS